MHIGGPKCGSSALQVFLTQNPKLQRIDGGIIEYWTVKSGENGKLEPLFSPVINVNHSKGFSYKNSESLRDEFKTRCIHSLFDKFVLENDGGKNKVFIFSTEGWSGVFQNTEITKCLCENKSYEIIVYLSVRPQIDMLIPSYLQWAIWEENPTLELAFKHLVRMADWEIQRQNAHKLGADKVDVRYTANIIEDFCDLYKVERSSVEQPFLKRINKSLPIEAISLLTRNRVLRPPKEPFMDFLIEDYIAEYNCETKPVIAKVPSELGSAVVEYFRSSNLKLFETMDEDQMSAFKSKSSDVMRQNSVGIGVEELSSNHLTIEFLEPLTVGLLADFRKFNGKRNQALMARDQALMARDQALMAKDQALMARDQALMAKDQALMAKDQIEKSRIWRYSRGYRFIRNLLR